MNPKVATKIGPFLIKKIIFALRFRMFRDNRVEKWGSIKLPSACIYIYMALDRIYIYIYMVRNVAE